MPWQRLVADVGMEIDPSTGLPAYREVIVTVMRQSGKSTLVLSFEVERCTVWDQPQRVAYTAQTGWDARRKLLDDQIPMVQSSPLWAAVQKVYRAQGAEGVLWRSGSRIDVMASNSAAGHGRTLDLGVIDEAFDDQDDRREQAILPAMATRPHAQLLIASTAGTELSLYLRRKVEAGRAAAVADKGSGIAYFEWSIPMDADIDDPEVWWAYMPALGWTISEAAVAHARQTMSDKEFRRGFGNQWTEAHEREIPPEAWRRVLNPTAAPSGDLRFGLDIPEDRSAGAITVCGNGVIELLEYRPGVGWILERAKELADRWDGPWVIDDGGPARYFADDLRAAGVQVERLGGPDVAAACGRMYDAIADGLVTFSTRGDFEPMQTAVDGLVGKPVGDRRVWSRTLSTSDISPFLAATLAYKPAGVAEPFALFG